LTSSQVSPAAVTTPATTASDSTIVLCEPAGTSAATTSAGSAGGSGTGHPDSDGLAAGDGAAATGTEGVGPATSTGADTDSVTTISPMKWLSEAFLTGTGRVVGVVGEGWLPGPVEEGEAADAGAEGADGAEGAATDAVGGTTGVVILTKPAPGPAVEEVVVTGPDRTAARRVVSVEGAGAATAGGAGAGAGRAITWGAAGRWAGTERSEVTT
jgi:hypothetical protein